MGKFLYRMEQKYGKYSVKNLPLVLIICYVVGYVLAMLAPNLYSYLVLNPYLVLHGQIWRLITWVLIPPPGSNIFFTLIMLYFYYSLATNLERTWGTFRFNVYIFSGMLFTILGSFVLYGIGWLKFSDIIGSVCSAEEVFTLSASVLIDGVYQTLPAVWFQQVSTYYINMSIFLAFAATFPEIQVLLMFIIPIKVKVLGIIYAGMLVYDMIVTDMAGRIVILASLLNFIIFFFMTRDYNRVSPREYKRKVDYRKKVRDAQNVGNASTYQGRNVITRHKCAICGRTELDDPNLEFRFCSKCEGNYEYCMDHLYTHEHVRRIVPNKPQDPQE